MSNYQYSYGGYRKLKSFQSAEIICDFTAEFCKRYINPKSRTIDQMEQAARSGKQNIAEGSKASGASPQTEIKLVSVARASLEELLLDYEDFLRQHNLKQWDKDNPQSLEIRKLANQTNKPNQSNQPNWSNQSNQINRSNQTDKSERTNRSNRSNRSNQSKGPNRSNQSNRPNKSYWRYLENPEQAANAMITLINQTNFLLDQQIKAIKQQHQDRGVVFGSREQRFRRISNKKLSEEKEFDTWIAEQLKNTNKSNQSD